MARVNISIITFQINGVRHVRSFVTTTVCSVVIVKTGEILTMRACLTHVTRSFAVKPNATKIL